jgi:hypothetical protein
MKEINTYENYTTPLLNKSKISTLEGLKFGKTHPLLFKNGNPVIVLGPQCNTY